MVDRVTLGGGRTLFPADGQMGTFELISAETAATACGSAATDQSTEPGTLPGMELALGPADLGGFGVAVGALEVPEARREGEPGTAVTAR